MTEAHDHPLDICRENVAPPNVGAEAAPTTAISRRDFLEAAGFTLSAAGITGCSRAPQLQSLPFANQPEGVQPGRTRQFASTCLACPAGCGLLVSVRDGRPLKMEGMPEHPLSRGGLCAVGQAQPLALYDSQRLSGPLHDGESIEWDDVDAKIIRELAKIRTDGGAVRVVTPTTNSPTLVRAIQEFLATFTDSRHIILDPGSASAILDAHKMTHGVRLLPQYRLDKAKMLVSFDADFLGSWISPVQHTAAWREQRSLPHRTLERPQHGAHRATDIHQQDESLAARPTAVQAEMSYHVQLEGRMSLTGSNADKRLCLHPQQIDLALRHLLQRLNKLAGKNVAQAQLGESPIRSSDLDQIAQGLWQFKGESIVLCGHNDVASQVVVNQLNELLENYGHTLDIERPSRQRQSNDSDLIQLTEELRQGTVSALIVAGVDLTYYLPSLADTINSTKLAISLSNYRDDFASRAEYVCPDHHPLESWLDAEPVAGLVSICQPTIQPMGNTRSTLESFSHWAGNTAPALELLKDTWKEHVFPRQHQENDFRRFWDRAVHDGFVDVDSLELNAGLQTAPSPQFTQVETDGLSVMLHPSIAIPDSRHAHNPWLQELPDPITKITWDNCLTVSPNLAKRKGLVESDVVELTTAEGESIELPVFIQPGQHDSLLTISLGYGVGGTDRFVNIGPQWWEARPTLGATGLVGVNASPLLGLGDEVIQYVRNNVQIRKTGRRHILATTQLHHSIEIPGEVAPPGHHDRQALVQNTTLTEFNKDPAAGAPQAHHFHGQLWPEDHPYSGHRWGMVIDLNRCTGCSACLIACQSENNVPVVGRDEVRRHREMHWIRIDRYYSGDSEEPQVLHQPMMCQHCGNAPCETVCPVLATVHSSEGLNQQVYNRCVGTRYCANNCPYKVRRFNWFEYARDDTLQNLALNPDVTVRTRGIMEKCSMCIQRIQEGKIEANRLHQQLADGAIQTACQQSCPADAIVFGDLADSQSRVSQAASDARNFRVLEELNVQPQVSYLRQVRNDSSIKGSV